MNKIELFFRLQDIVNMLARKILREPLFYLLPLLVALYLLGFPVHMEISDVKITRDRITENVNLPYTADMRHNEIFFISFNLATKNKTAKLNIIPDDCIQEILINGKNFPLDGIGGLCDYSNGAHFDFSEYVKEGLNHFKLRIINSGGGAAGLKIEPQEESSFFMFYILALLSLVSIVLIIIKFKSNIASIKNFILSPKFSRRQHYIIFALTLFFAILLRLWSLGTVPNGLHQDEALLAYDAYADIYYNMDSNGDHNPVYAVAWGSGQNMGYNYILRPFIMLFGLNDIVVRLPMALFSIYSLIIFYLLLRYLFGASTGLLGFFLLATNPWHIILSRWAIENNFVLPLFLTGIYFAVLSYKKHIFFILGMLFFALSLYAYAAAAIVCLIFIPSLILYVFIRKKIPVKYTTLGILAFGLICTPFVLWAIINTFDFPAFKFLGLTIPRMTVMRSASIVSFSFNNFTHFGEVMLTGLDGWLCHAIPPFGAFYSFMLPFIVFGIYMLFVKHKAFEMKMWLISAIILALSINMNLGRMNLILFPLICLAALGIAEIQRNTKFVVPILASLIIISTIAFTRIYPTTYEQNNYYFTNFDKALKYALQNSQPDAIIYFGGGVPYPLVLYITKIPPQRFLSTVVWQNPHVEFRNTVRFDRFIARVPHSMETGETGVFHRNEVNGEMRNTAKKITSFGNFLVVEN
jgi:4-amino-4-deoxy-L-arabinose transferase-like glycosyltransferase